MKTLKEICDYETREDIRDTDKGRGERNHLELYEQLFPPYRFSASKVFEIGVRRGGSIRMWREYFTKAVIYGLDLSKVSVDNVAGDRIVGIHFDQSDKEQLEAFGKNYGPFDIGIDDASHVWSHQILTFEALWKYICPGGLFVIEDVITSYPIWLQHSTSAKRTDYTQGGVSLVEYFKCLVDEINFNGEDWDSIDKSKYTEFQSTIDWIAFRSNSIFVRKRDDA